MTGSRKAVPGQNVFNRIAAAGFGSALVRNALPPHPRLRPAEVFGGRRIGLMAPPEGQDTSMKPKTAIRHRWMIVAMVLAPFAVLTACGMHPSRSERPGQSPAAQPTHVTITLHSGEGAQFEIIGPHNQRVLVDISDPSLLSRPADSADILLTTHFHFDHFNQAFIDAFPGMHLHGRQGRIERRGMVIQSIAGHHSEHPWDPDNPAWDNYLFVIEMEGVRIAHFGDIGQRHLSADQMKRLGRVDIAITQFINPLSQMNLENRKGYRLMDRLRPRIIIPHHGADSDEAIRLAMARWDVAYVPGDHLHLTLSRPSLPERTTVLIMGEMAEYMRKTFHLKPWP